MDFRTFSDMERAIRGMLPRVPRDTDVVVGIPRSGMPPAAMLALYLNRPMTDLEGFLEGRLIRSGNRPVAGGKAPGAPGGDAELIRNARRVLIVDDCVGNGTQLRKIRDRLDAMDLPQHLTYTAVFTTAKGLDLLDLWSEEIGWPMCFQWNVMQHPDYLGRACLDMDGVLCINPTDHQDDDGPLYKKFLKEAGPLFVPTYKLGAIVTSRSEAVRPETEAWLDRHGITYDQLVMTDPVPPPRPQRFEHGVKHKVDFYRDSDAILFIESDRPVSVEIANRTGRPVYCVDTQEMLLPGAKAAAVAKLRRSPRKVFREVKKRVKRSLPRPTTATTGTA
jgi:uncharacterized HAD superfamily protein